MVCSPITEDYYMILEVEQNASPQSIVSSYRRLALKLHPDRNAKHDATEAFQRLGRAYETLKDETKRRAYNLIYPSIRQSHPPPQRTQTPHPTTASTPQAGTLSEAAQIAVIQKLKQERSERWREKKNTFNSLILDLREHIGKLEQEIKNLDSISAAEAAADARKNSWATWFLSPIYKKVEDSEEEKERKDRKRQERRIEKDMKERRLEFYSADLKMQEKLFRNAKEELDAANRCDDVKIQAIQARVMARERQERERQEKERLKKERQRLERERLEKERQRLKRERQERERQQEIEDLWKKQQKERQDKMTEALRKQQKEKLSAEKKQKKAREARNHYAYPNTSERNTGQAYTSICQHHGWWPKVQGRRNCPNCDQNWTYLLECPGCEMKRCPKCQAAIRRARMNRKAPPPARTPSPDFGYDYSW
ncbi:hypothetical protein COCSADRAFT_125882 [Bipolaris sorokiniana ND90Pr]|uniref:J domain-containing protein n=1 Tax=Cochliobolus sativus (strain ND90Pr / ATCC 201652) TaxID=665912 RepID=M2SVA4_COCSN|nr:uncharacterized protein COCSADRAFT_125882 [Bipolaris sorokiniana ND90Pr]EMD60742.1 hypothetical protein COCSADRAFT_125882 [Bipolaris sorokiniana ND90Pr]